MSSLVYRGQFLFVINLKRLIDGLKQNLLRKNDWTSDNLTNNKRLPKCDNRQIETHQ